MSIAANPPSPAVEFLDITPLARRYGFRIDVKIARELADRANDETVIGCVLRAAADALMMRGSRLGMISPFQSMKLMEATLNPLVFAIKTMRAPAQLLGHLRLAMQLDDRHYAEPTITLRLAA
ncbi:MAG TPA: hypothetical protein VF460_04920 [Burkholderiales bacterium]